MNRIVAFTLSITLLIVGTFFYFSSPSSEKESIRNEAVAEKNTSDNRHSELSYIDPSAQEKSKKKYSSDAFISHGSENFTSFTSEDYSTKQPYKYSSVIANATVEMPKITDYQLNNHISDLAYSSLPPQITSEATYTSLSAEPPRRFETYYGDPNENEVESDDSYDYADEYPNTHGNFNYWGNRSWAYIDHVEGHWRDNRHGYTSFGVFMAYPYYTCNLVPFLDLRGHIFNNGRFGANLGGGLRYQPCESLTVYGANIYYDSRVADFRHRYEQLGLGFEILNPCWDFRINGYLPIGQKTGHSRPCVFDQFTGGFRATSEQRRRSMGGFDAQVGRWFNSTCGFLNLYGALGVYTYFPKTYKHNICGGEARLVSNIYRNLLLELRGSYDPIFHTKVQARLTYSIPFEQLFGCCYKSACDDCCNCLMYQPIYREEVIALDKKRCCWKWNWEDSGSSCSTCGDR
jgi:hypothetical protein